MEGGVRHHPPRAAGPAGPTGEWRRWTMDGWAPLDPDEPVVPRLLVRGRRLRPSTRRSAPDRGGVGEGGDLGPGARAARRVPVGRRAAASGGRANLDHGAARPGARRRATRTAPRRAARSGMLGDVWEWTASDFGGYDGFVAHPYREYSEVFFGSDYKVLRGGSWATRARVATPTFRNWDLPAAPADLLGGEAGMGRVTTPPATCGSTSTSAARARCADDVLDGLTRPFKELPPKHLYDARGSRAVRRDLRAARVLPDAHRAGDPRPTTPTRSCAARAAAELVELGSGSGVQDARAARRDGARPARCWRYVPFDVAEQMVRDCAAALADEYPELDDPRDRRRLRAPPRRDPAVRARPPARGRVPRRHDRQLPAGRRAAASCADWRGCSRPATTCCSAPTSSRTSTCWRPPTTTRRASPPSSTSTCCTCSTASSTPTSRPSCSSTSRSSIPSTSGSRCACARAAPATCASTRSTSTIAFARGEELRTEISAKFTRERLEADYAAAGLELAEWFTDEEGLFALSLASKA